MAKTKRALVFATFLVSCSAVVLAIVSLATENWVNGEVIVRNKLDPTTKVSFVNYGLFAGTFEEYLLNTPQVKSMITVCLMSENICMLSISESAEARDQEIQALFDGNCPSSRDLDKDVPVSNTLEYLLRSDTMYLLKQGHNVVLDSSIRNNRINKSKTQIEMYKNEVEEEPVAASTKDAICYKNFLNAGLWVMTIFFMVLSLCMGVVTAAFSVINTASNPTSQWISIWGLYLWNAVAAVGYLLTMIMWGAQFGEYVLEDVAMSDTLNGSYKNTDVTNLGYSYWLILGSLILHIANVGILFLRQFLISREPKAPTIKQDLDKDGMIFVY